MLRFVRGVTLALAVAVAEVDGQFSTARVVVEDGADSIVEGAAYKMEREAGLFSFVGLKIGCQSACIFREEVSNDVVKDLVGQVEQCRCLLRFVKLCAAAVSHDLCL